MGVFVGRGEERWLILTKEEVIKTAKEMVMCN